MNKQWQWPINEPKHLVLGCQVSLLVFLTACGGGQGASEESERVASSANAALSAAQLAQDDTLTLSQAQAVAAGIITAESLLQATQNESITDGAQAGTDTANEQTDTPAQGAALPEQESSTDTEANNGTGGSPITVDTSATGQSTNSETTDSSQTNSTDTQSQTVASAQSSSENQSNNTDTTGEESQNEPDVGEAVAQTQFSSHTTEGFNGVLNDDGTVTISWQRDPTARGYNVYRQAQYIETVFAESWTDENTFDESYYYEIQAFDFADNFNYIAKGLTVDVTGTGRINPDSPKPKEGILDGYELVFSDEFNGDSLDPAKWNTQYLWGPDLVINSEEQYYVDTMNNPDFGYNPFSFDGDNLIISAIRTPSELLQTAKDQPYLSGVITSYDAFKFTYGFVEARVQMPYGQGLWPAFWLLNAYYVDDKPEIDIMEHIGDDQDVAYHTYHYYDADGELRSTKSEPTVGIDFTADFHTFAVEWSPGTLIFYVDGIERHRISDPKVSQQDMYIIANTAIGGWWPGSPDSSTKFPTEYKIDYIRAYQKQDVFNDAPVFEDDTTKVPYADDVPGSSPNHLPPFELWPEGYPERL